MTHQAAAAAADRTRTGRPAILSEDASLLLDLGRCESACIARVVLGCYFNVIELDDNCVGASMNYSALHRRVLLQVEQRLSRQAAADPLLLGTLFPECVPAGYRGHPPGPDSGRTGTALLRESLRAALVSALSVPFLTGDGDGRGYTCSADAAALSAIRRQARRVLVVGFGGLLGYLAAGPSVTDLHVTDLAYGARRTEIDTWLRGLRRQFPDVCITASDGTDTAGVLERADTVSIARDPGGWKDLRRFLRLWTLRAIAVTQPGYYQAREAAPAGTGGSMLLPDVIRQHRADR